MRKLWQLFSTFFILGLFTFGGGIAMLPFIKRKAVSLYWIKEEAWPEIVTLAQLSPGAIAVNTANLIGYQVAKKTGSLIAVLGMILPPIIVITLLATGLQSWLTIPLVINALDGMLIVIFILFAKAVFDLGKIAWKTWWMVPMSLASFVLVYFEILSPILVMIIATLFALVLTRYQGSKR
jgi:chromate transporter